MIDLETVLYSCWRKGFKTAKIIEKVHQVFGEHEYTDEQIMETFREVFDKGVRN